MGTITRLGLALLLASSPISVAFADDPIRPDPSMTPGLIDSTVGDNNICAHDWTYGGAGNPPVEAGSDTYSKAARRTPTATKERSFQEYGLSDPHDGGKSYEVDHRVPLSLGGRDDIRNLWPETRDRSVQWNAWVKDRLEFKIYNMVCHPTGGQAAMHVQDAQAVFLGDWVAGYQQYCPTDGDCPVYGGGGND
jgi:hypothetical protein